MVARPGSLICTVPKVPSPLPSVVITVPEVVIIAASGFPSKFRWSSVRCAGRTGRARAFSAPKAPPPRPRKTESVSGAQWVTTRSSLPSLFMSCSRTSSGLPNVKGCADWAPKVPSPLPGAKRQDIRVIEKQPVDKAVAIELRELHPNTFAVGKGNGLFVVIPQARGQSHQESQTRCQVDATLRRRVEHDDLRDDLNSTQRRVERGLLEQALLRALRIKLESLSKLRSAYVALATKAGQRQDDLILTDIENADRAWRSVVYPPCERLPNYRCSNNRELGNARKAGSSEPDFRDLRLRTSSWRANSTRTAKGCEEGRDQETTQSEDW